MVCGVICCEFVCLSAWLVGYAGFLVLRVLGLLCYCLWVTSVVWLYGGLNALFVGCFSELRICLGLCGACFCWAWVLVGLGDLFCCF